MRKDNELTTRIYNSLLERIAEILNQARTKVVREINRAQVLACWEIGREIVEFEQKGKTRADYGEGLLKRLSADMTTKFGRGFSRSNLQNMRLFYLAYPKCQTVSGKSLKGQKSQAVSAKSEEMQKFQDDIFAKHVLGGLSNKVFASKYRLALPSEKELRVKLKSIPLIRK